MTEYFSAGDLPNAFYILPAVAIVYDENTTVLQICLFKWFIDITLKTNGN